MMQKCGQILSVVGALIVWTQPALAQGAEASDKAVSLDLVLSQSRDLTSAMSLAHQQAASGDYVASAATLERIQLLYSNDDDVRLAHAIMLCHLDDPLGAMAELESMADKAVVERRWDEVKAACGGMERLGSSEVGS